MIRNVTSANITANSVLLMLLTAWPSSSPLIMSVKLPLVVALRVMTVVPVTSVLLRVVVTACELLLEVVDRAVLVSVVVDALVNKPTPVLVVVLVEAFIVDVDTEALANVNVVGPTMVLVLVCGEVVVLLDPVLVFCVTVVDMDSVYILTPTLVVVPTGLVLV